MVMEEGLENIKDTPEKKPKYTLEDLERERSWQGRDSNNLRADFRDLKEHLRRLQNIEDCLKAEGVLE